MRLKILGDYLQFMMKPCLMFKKYYSYLHHLPNLVTVILLFILVSTAGAYDVVIGWDPNTENDLAGYVLYVDDGTSNLPYEYVDTYPLEDIDPSNPASQITGLEDDQVYYFVVTAYNTEGIESDYSEEICVQNGQACASRSFGAGGSGGGGNTGCFISSMNNGKSVLKNSSVWFLSILMLVCLSWAVLDINKNGYSNLKRSLSRLDVGPR